MNRGDQLKEQLKRAGYRVTRQRVAVLRVMAESPTTLSAQELWERSKRHCPELGLATVYRTLEALNTVGGVERVHAADGQGFVSCPSGDHHHVVCVSCGRVAEFERCNLETLIPRVAEETGYQVQSHLLELAGFCPDCLAQREVR